MKARIVLEPTEEVLAQMPPQLAALLRDSAPGVTFSVKNMAEAKRIAANGIEGVTAPWHLEVEVEGEHPCHVGARRMSEMPKTKAGQRLLVSYVTPDKIVEVEREAVADLHSGTGYCIECVRKFLATLPETYTPEAWRELRRQAGL